MEGGEGVGEGAKESLLGVGSAAKWVGGKLVGEIQYVFTLSAKR